MEMTGGETCLLGFHFKTAQNEHSKGNSFRYHDLQSEIDLAIELDMRTQRGHTSEKSLDDFILGSARFQLPNYSDVDKWGNRVVNNILYYQTNYFVLSLLVFLCVGCIHPVKMLLGSCCITSAFILYHYITRQRSAIEFKRKYPWLGIVVIFLGAYFIIYLLDSVLIFFFGILLPICLIFIHSSLRLRNMKNKMSNKIEIIGLKRSPMGKFLELLVMRKQSLAYHAVPPRAYKKSLSR